MSGRCRPGDPDFPTRKQFVEARMHVYVSGGFEPTEERRRMAGECYDLLVGPDDVFKASLARAVPEIDAHLEKTNPQNRPSVT